ncbi:hypothetical protein FE257_010750 [Aspergillus nanangensis]|uniref:YCII-related domain-containing protein n=1 Tax=Aspergillus nanangensis TaxID=2582783 RepID=A0AAD4CVV3_ASPNN|nr:hypothetical protein FE257_010750 [Aspergillus nanangensis]
MATRTAGQKEFLCILPDKPNVLDIRKRVKSIHYEGIQPLIKSGRLVAGGAMFDTHPGEGEDALFKGSMIVYTGENEEEVRVLIDNDIYARSGVWDLDRVQIVPEYKSAVREPMD